MSDLFGGMKPNVDWFPAASSQTAQGSASPGNISDPNTRGGVWCWPPRRRTMDWAGLEPPRTLRPGPVCADGDSGAGAGGQPRAASWGVVLAAPGQTGPSLQVSSPRGLGPVPSAELGVPLFLSSHPWGARPRGLSVKMVRCSRAWRSL